MKRFRWALVWLIQMLSMLLLGALAALTELLPAWCCALVMWCAVPLSGAVSAYLSVRKGLNNYLAWIAPPVCTALGYLIVWTYVPHAGAMLMCAFVSLVGAAAGEVKKSHQRQ